VLGELERVGRRRPVGIVSAVDPESPAGVAGVRPSDRLLAVNGLVPRDVIDVRLDAATDHVELDLERDGEPLLVELDKDPDEDLGIEFESAAFDRMKTCNNRCEFCFIRGLPPGLRRSLYIKDDDYRYSFLYGNFTTLTNLTTTDWKRLLYQRLGPLRVSVHATDPELRRDLLSNPNAPPILEQIARLGEHGIHIHAQIVLMPGRNDGAALEQTLDELAACYPTVESAAVVPVGLTAHSHVEHIRPLTPEDAARAIDQVEVRQKRHRKELGIGFVYAADELYLLAGRPLPPPRAYDDYPQLENGVGLIQLFRDAWKRATRRLPERIESPRRVLWATGALTAPLFGEFAHELERIPDVSIEVVQIRNSLFGGEVTVAGLVPGRDVIEALRGREVDLVVLPRSMFDMEGRQTIDNVSVQEIANELGTDVLVGSSARDLVDATLRPARISSAVVRPQALENDACVELSATPAASP
jgi:putative radical SAM enzyme (TIGR03279 family)